jgi:hypothetical protein
MLEGGRLWPARLLRANPCSEACALHTTGRSSRLAALESRSWPAPRALALASDQLGAQALRSLLVGWIGHRARKSNSFRRFLRRTASVSRNEFGRVSQADRPTVTVIEPRGPPVPRRDQPGRRASAQSPCVQARVRERYSTWKRATRSLAPDARPGHALIIDSGWREVGTASLRTAAWSPPR